MEPSHEQNCKSLLEQAACGDSSAAEALLMAHKNRLRAMIVLRLDPRISARIDPSDVLQETLAEAYQKLPDYLRNQSVAFYPWLRSLAWERIVRLHRQHVLAQARAVTREQRLDRGLTDRSALELANQLVAKGESPSHQLMQAELKARVRETLADLRVRDREVLILRYLEHMSIDETAATLEISSDAVKSRQRRALERFSTIMMHDERSGDSI